MTKVLFTENVDPVGPELLKEAGCEVVMADRDDALIRKEIQTAAAVVTRTYEVPPELLERAANRKIVRKHGAG